MILVDTSVWIEYFRQNKEFTGEIKRLIKSRQVVTIEPIFSELVFGVRTNRDRGLIRSFWSVLPRIKFGDGEMIEAAAFANERDYYQKGIGLMDSIIIKSAIDGDHRIWTLDKRIIANSRNEILYS